MRGHELANSLQSFRVHSRYTFFGLLKTFTERDILLSSINCRVGIFFTTFYFVGNKGTDTFRLSSFCLFLGREDVQ